MKRKELLNTEISLKIKPLSKKDIGLILRAIQYIKPYKIKFIIAFFCVLVGVTFSVIQPILWAKVLICLVSRSFSDMLTNVMYIFILFTVQTLNSFLQSYLFSCLTENIIYDMKNDMFNKILNLPIKVFDEMRVGDFISRLHNDTSAVANVITNQFLNSLVDVLRVLVISVVVFSMSIPLALLLIATFPVSFVIFLQTGKILRRKHRETNIAQDNYFSNIQQSVAGIRDIRGLGLVQTKLKEFTSYSKELRDKKVSIKVWGALSQSITQASGFISQLACMLMGGYFIYKGILTLEYFVAFSSYSNQYSVSLMNLTKLNSNIQEALTSLERVFNLMDDLNYSKENYEETQVETVKGSITFDNIYFGYAKKIPVLKGVSFEIPANKKIAIVGKSGSGKSTIFNMLLRFYKPFEGNIYIDDLNIKEFSEESLRRHVAVVRQETFLFNTTIEKNLLLVNPKATREDVIRCCKSAYIHDFIMNLPRGYDTIIEDNGSNFSGGQKQRLAIARALLKNSKIILFDEATSALDNESQQYIRKAIDELSESHTVLIIAHNLLSIIQTDEIIVIENGRIAGRGTHETLISNNEIYVKMYKSELEILQNTSNQQVGNLA